MDENGLLFSADACFAVILILMLSLTWFSEIKGLAEKENKILGDFDEKAGLLLLADSLVKLPEGKGLAIFDYDKKIVIENHVRIVKMPHESKKYWVEIAAENGKKIRINKCNKKALVAERLVIFDAKVSLLNVGFCE